MTFNQWFSSQSVRSFRIKIALEAIWQALTGAGINPREVARMLEDVLEEMREEA